MGYLHLYSHSICHLICHHAEQLQDLIQCCSRFQHRVPNRDRVDDSQTYLKYV